MQQSGRQTAREGVQLLQPLHKVCAVFIRSYTIVWVSFCKIRQQIWRPNQHLHSVVTDVYLFCILQKSVQVVSLLSHFQDVLKVHQDVAAAVAFNCANC